MKTYPNSVNPFTRLALLLMLIVAAAALVACGGDAPEDAELPTAAAPAATEAAPPEPTEIPPTAEPTAEPTTVPPTEAPEEPAFATGECGNAFYPVVEGRIMNYTTNAGDIGGGDFATTFSDVTDSSFTLSTDLGDGELIATDWQCSDEGLLSPEFSQMPSGMEGMTIEFVEATGVTIPTEDKFQLGESWPTHYVANATVPIDDTNSMAMTQTFDMVNTVTAVEPVSVPAGDYPDAVVVETVATISVAMAVDGTTQPAMTIEMNYLSWYVEDIGLVRQEISGFFADTGDSYITELISVE